MREIVLYTRERLNEAQRRMKRSAVELAMAAAVGALLCAVGIGLRWQWMCVGGLVLGSWLAYYLLDTGLRPMMAETEFVRRMVRVQPGRMAVMWGEIAPEKVYVEGVRATEIHCRQGESRKTFYLRAEDALPEIAAGEMVQIESVDRFIVKITPMEA